MQIAICTKDSATYSPEFASHLGHTSKAAAQRSRCDNLQFSFFNFQFAISESSRVSAQTSNLKWLSPGKSGFDIVPPFNLIAFVGFPAEKNDAAIAHRGKV